MRRLPTAVTQPQPPATMSRLALSDRRISGRGEGEGVIFADAIPRNQTGKILKRLLREQYSVSVPM